MITVALLLPSPQALAQDNTYAELADLVAKTQIIEARIKLSDAALRLKTSQSALHQLSLDSTNPNSVSASDLSRPALPPSAARLSRDAVSVASSLLANYKIWCVVGDEGSVAAIVITPSGQRLWVHVGELLGGIAAITDISPSHGVRAGGQLLAFTDNTVDEPSLHEPVLARSVTQPILASPFPGR